MKKGQRELAFFHFVCPNQALKPSNNLLLPDKLTWLLSKK